LRPIGLLMAGMPQSEVISGSLLAARKHGLPVESLSASDIRARYPVLRVRDAEVGVFEREAGAVFPERAIRAHLDLAREHGAQMRFRTGMRAWQSGEAGVTVELSDGTSVRTRSLVLTLGPWFTQALLEAGVNLEVQRNVQVWFTPQTAAYDAAAFPAFLIERDSLPAPLYGFPDFGDGVKAAFHALGALTDPEDLVREIDPQTDVQPVARALEDWMPGAAGSFREGKACMYALTPDRHFVIDTHPRDARVVLCGGFSGHGFKFASVVGEIAAQLALDGGTPHPIDFLGLRRFRA
jgi:sarcosine oxidase